MKLDWQKMNGLVPAVVQDAATKRVLMLGYMSEESLAATLATRRVTFYSRSRQALWEKGATSGHRLALVDVQADCDGDALLVSAKPEGPTCHTGDDSCFSLVNEADDTLGRLWRTIESRAVKGDDRSYTRRLLAAGLPRIAQKVGEEGVEVALAAVTRDDAGVTAEAADLVYHLLVLLKARGLRPDDLLGELARRLSES